MISSRIGRNHCVEDEVETELRRSSRGNCPGVVSNSRSSLDERRTRTNDNHGRLSGPHRGSERPMEGEVRLPTGNSQEEVDRLPSGNAVTSRSRPCSDALFHS